MRESPRIRRLRTDLRALEQLRADSSIVDFTIPGRMGAGPPEAYVIHFRGRGLSRASRSDKVHVREEHRVRIQLGAGYPRMMPELLWQTPIFHPNISGSGVVCLGGYATHWVPSLNLDELCTMLWDMVRYANYDVESPYNREAAHWVRNQQRFSFPTDPRPIRDRLAGITVEAQPRKPPVTIPPPQQALHETEVIEAEVVEVHDAPAEQPDILFLE